ncbi:MAG: hypothetical protein H7267_11930 [Sandarakinorhabdus sp.]|nr:hypothetical protein [Sandarakinorhabdus sp.]
MADLPPDTSITDIVRDPRWFAYHFDPSHDAVQFRHILRPAHARATFLTDEYLGAGDIVAIRRGDVEAAPIAAAGSAPLHFIFHSAFCCSTMLARAFDLPGLAMGLKEPMILQDLIGWQHRGARPVQIAPVLETVLDLLARPFTLGESIVVKPSNITNSLAPAILTMRPEARALLLYAPLRVYLGSIARKGMTGRLWVRDLLVKQLQEGLHGFGFNATDYLGQTDLQVAAMGWLAQHALFMRMAADFGPRVVALDSETLVAAPVVAMTGIAAHFGVDCDVEAIVAGPAFTRHSKSDVGFSAVDRSAATASEASHADEIDKVAIWTEAVAKAAGVSLVLPGRLAR